MWIVLAIVLATSNQRQHDSLAAAVRCRTQCGTTHLCAHEVQQPGHRPKAPAPLLAGVAHLRRAPWSKGEPKQPGLGTGRSPKLGARARATYGP